MDRAAGTLNRGRRDLTVDLCFVAIASLLVAVDYLELAADDEPGWKVAVFVAAGLAASASLWYRRRWPVGVALSTALLSAVVPAATGASLLAVFSIAVHRPWRIAVAVGAVAFVCAAVPNGLDPEGESVWLLVALIFIVHAALVGWGMYVRARRELLESLRQRARDAEADRDARAARARTQERTRIAREMHDVLAHRISLVALNAGALEYRPDASPEEVGRAAGVVRENAHQALEELRGVIVVLREDPDGDPGTAPPQPTLRDLSALVDECRDSGMTVELEAEADDLERLPDGTGRTAYRVVQEGLTNVRKHASGGAGRVTITGGAGPGLTVTVTDDGQASPAIEPIPGAGTGLTGLTERVGLAGGRIEYGPRSDRGFRLQVWLPWGGAVTDGPSRPQGEAAG